MPKINGLPGRLNDIEDVNAGSPSDNHALTWDDGTSKWINEAIAAGFYDAYVCVRDKKSVGTASGTFTQDAWRTRDLTEELADTASIASLSSNQITLAAGTYRCIISCPSYITGRNQARLRDITNGVTLLVGTSELAHASHAAYSRSWIVGRFTLAAQTVLEVQHYCLSTTANDGFGYQLGQVDEIYTVAEFWREA